MRRASLLFFGVAAVAPFGAVAACGGATVRDEADASPAPSSTVNVLCPGIGNVRRAPRPSGACNPTTDALCEFSDPSFPCKPGDQVYPKSYNWRCTCPEGEWTCEYFGAPLSSIDCPNYDAGADADSSLDGADEGGSDGGADG
ncbi:MAG: hypothetical protein JST00_12005 [Deltaproteobacteria bacterium]|nr:hypothetical protein [Deltaproteobacteria bacterium]